MASQTAAVSGGVLSFSCLVRMFGWGLLAVMTVFLLNNFLIHGAGLPGAVPDGSAGFAGVFQAALYGVAIMLVIAFVALSQETSLRTDSERIDTINIFLIRAAFWCVLVTGSVDAVISFMRVEGLLEAAFGEELARDLGSSRFRGMYVHFPLIAAGILLAAFSRTAGFHWLALLIVVAELVIVFMRFLFSYEQTFMSDLARFWYGALFLFASAHTLKTEGHVRVDIFYAGFSDTMKAAVNAFGAIVLGLPFCWTILILGMGQKTSIINSPIINFEVTQSGFGMYVKYMMAGFLGIFAVSMMIQFVSSLMGSVADCRGEPAKRPALEPAGQ